VIAYTHARPQVLTVAFEDAVDDDDVAALRDAAHAKWPEDVAVEYATELAGKCLQSRGRRRPTATALAKAAMAMRSKHACSPMQLAPEKVATCVVCLDEVATHACVPCGHKCLCADDAAVIAPHNKCPLCRAHLTNLIRVFD
jgi:hypothetical protein